MKEEVVIGTIETPIFMYLISDPTNIDSKMVTSINKSVPHLQREALFQSLYKFDASQ
jgi:hypothetical protein